MAEELSDQQQVQQQTLSLQVTTLEQQVATLEDEIDALEAGGSDTLEQARQRLVDQQADFVQRFDEVSIDSSLASGGAQIVQPASVPSDPIRPKPLSNMLIGLVVGSDHRHGRGLPPRVLRRLDHLAVGPVQARRRT